MMKRQKIALKTSMILSLFSVTLEMTCVHWSSFLSLPPPHSSLSSSQDLKDVVTFVLFIVQPGNKIPLS